MTFVNQFFIATAAFVLSELFVDHVCGLAGQVYVSSDKDLLLDFFQSVAKTV